MYRFPTYEQRAIVDILRKNFRFLKEVFVDRASSSREYPGVDLGIVKKMAREWKVLDEAKITELFIIANFDKEDFN